MRDIGDARHDLREALVGPARTTDAAALAASQPLWKRVAAVVVGATAVAAVTGGGVWIALRPAPLRVSRLSFTPSDVAALFSGGNPNIAITPDGSRVVYPGSDGALLVRALDQLEESRLAELGRPQVPFVSPDGQWVGFADGQSAMRRVPIGGGTGVLVAPLDGTLRGATWGPDDTIVYATLSPATGLQQVRAGGGTPTVLTTPNRAANEADHFWPQVLPGGQAVLFTITATSGGPAAGTIAVLDRRTGAQRILLRGGSHGQYVASGHLVFHSEGTLRAVAFDPATLTVVGTPVEVGPSVRVSGSGAANVAVSDDGTLVYVPQLGPGFRSPRRTLVWVDRQGRDTPIPAAMPRQYVYPRVAPNDDTRIAAFAQADEEESTTWLLNLVRTTSTRVVAQPSFDSYPVWAPDGKRLYFNSTRGGQRNVFTQLADDAATLERVTESPNVHMPTSVSPDGTRLVFTEISPRTGEDVMMAMLGPGPTKAASPLVQTPAVE